MGFLVSWDQWMLYFVSLLLSLWSVCFSVKKKCFNSEEPQHPNQGRNPFTRQRKCFPWPPFWSSGMTIWFIGSVVVMSFISLFCIKDLAWALKCACPLQWATPTVLWKILNIKATLHSYIINFSWLYYTIPILKSCFYLLTFH